MEVRNPSRGSGLPPVQPTVSRRHASHSVSASRFSSSYLCRSCTLLIPCCACAIASLWRVAGSPLITPFAQQHLGGGMSAASGHRTDFRGELLERSSRLRRERLAQDFAVLGFGRAAVFGGAQFETSDELRIEVA